MSDVIDYERLDMDALKLLHAHTYARIMWYRSEMWRVTTPIWSGFGAFLIAMISTAVFLRKENISGLGLALIIGIGVVASLVNVLFYAYVGRLYASIDVLNNLMTDREIALSRRVGMFQKVPGFMEADHSYIQHKVFPGLDILFVLSNVILSMASVGIIYIVAPG